MTADVIISKNVFGSPMISSIDLTAYSNDTPASTVRSTMCDKIKPQTSATTWRSVVKRSWIWAATPPAVGCEVRGRMNLPSFAISNFSCLGVRVSSKSSAAHMSNSASLARAVFFFFIISIIFFSFSLAHQAAVLDAPVVDDGQHRTKFIWRQAIEVLPQRVSLLAEVVSLRAAVSLRSTKRRQH